MQQERKKNSAKGSKSSVWETHQDLTFKGNITNISGAFNLHDAGSIRLIERSVTRENFMDRYLEDIAGMFSLNDGQEVLLKYMLSNKRYASPFLYNEETKVDMAEGAGLKITTINDYFRSLVSAKRLIIRMKQWRYRLNEEFLFLPGEIKNADFLGMRMTYVFDTPAAKIVVPGAPAGEVTLAHIEGLMEMYRQQEARRELNKKTNDINESTLPH